MYTVILQSGQDLFVSDWHINCSKYKVKIFLQNVDRWMSVISNVRMDGWMRVDRMDGRMSMDWMDG